MASKKTFLCAAFSLCVLGGAEASFADAPAFSAQRCFPEKGKANLPCVNEEIQALERVASGWPPKTKDAAEKQIAGKNVLVLHEGIIVALNSIGASKEVFLNTAWTAHMGYNLDVPGMGKRADELYKQFVKLYPEDALGNFRYGLFLSGLSGSQKDSIPFLEKAISLGEKQAQFTLGATYATLQEKEKAIKALSGYLQDYPNDSKARELLAAIEKGNSFVVTSPSGN